MSERPRRFLVPASRATARAVGALFILASATAIIGGTLLLPLEEPGVLQAVADAEGQVVTGALLELVLVLSVMAIAALLVPVLAAVDEGLAHAYLGVRILEGVLLLAAAASALVVVGASRDPAAAGGQATSEAMLAIRRGTYDLGSLAMFGVSAVILNALLLRGRLVPVWISVWGLLGGGLILAGGLIVLYGTDPSDVTISLMAAPIGLNEMVLAIWLIVRGFDVPTVAPSGERVASTVAPAGRRVAGEQR
jgi:hypothetical protein